MSIDIDVYLADDLTEELLNKLINENKSFRITDIKEMAHVIKNVERTIEANKRSCRVYTEYRATAMSGAIIPTGVTQAVGLFSAIGIGLHNLITYNPDYELGKNNITNTLTVINKK